ncbi:MAG: histidinol-phosphate transaminase, partial [Pseudomonadota bacterium]
AMAAYHAAMNSLERYPDGSSLELRETIGKVHGLPTDNLIIGAGSDDIITLLIRAYANEGDEILQTEYGFSYYAIAAKAALVGTSFAPETAYCADIGKTLKTVGPKTKILFLANPNNPTGTVLNAAEIKDLRAELPPHILLILDGAYAEYMDDPDYTDGADLVAETIGSGADNVVMMRTFSKIYGLGGLRVGWAYAPTSIISILNRLRSPFNVSAPGLKAAVAAMEDQEFVAQNRVHNAKERARIDMALKGLGFQTIPSHGNFILFDAKSPDNAQTLLKTLEGDGVLIRSTASSNLPQHLRVSIGDQPANDAFLQSLTRAVQNA